MVAAGMWGKVTVAAAAGMWIPSEEGWDGHIAQLQVWDSWTKAAALYQGWKGRVLENLGITGAASADVSKSPSVVYHGLQHDGVEAPLVVVGAIHLGWAGDRDVYPVESPDALEEAEYPEACHHLHGVSDPNHKVDQHILEGTADPCD